MIDKQVRPIELQHLTYYYSIGLFVVALVLHKQNDVMRNSNLVLRK